jgi:hypothetical protein
VKGLACQTNVSIHFIIILPRRPFEAAHFSRGCGDTEPAVSVGCLLGLVEDYFFYNMTPNFMGPFYVTVTPNIMGLFYVLSLMGLSYVPETHNIMGLSYVERPLFNMGLSYVQLLK